MCNVNYVMMYLWRACDFSSSVNYFVWLLALNHGGALRLASDRATKE